MKWKPMTTTVEPTSQILGVVYQDKTEDKADEFRLVYQKADGTVYNQQLDLLSAEVICTPLKKGTKQFLNFILTTDNNQFHYSVIFPPIIKEDLEETDLMTILVTVGLALVFTAVVLLGMFLITKARESQARDMEPEEKLAISKDEEKEPVNPFLGLGGELKEQLQEE